jgi:murein DD-endopeptidase MepM/ murein hydrolase activator NlpD
MGELFRVQLILLALLGVGACQSASPTAVSTSIVVPSETASPIPNTETPTPSPSASQMPATATNTLAPFPIEVESIDVVRSSVGALKPANIKAPLALAPFDHFYFSYPLPLSALERILPSSRYGNDQGPDTSAGHTGLDVGIDTSTPILAAGSGKVIFSGYGLLTGYDNPDDAYGIAVVIAHDFGYEGQALYTVYAHMSKSLVELGQLVEEGEEIGRSGNTGTSTGPHLHFEVRLGKNNIYNSRNPELWITPPEGWGVLVGQLYTTYGTRLMGQALKITSLDSGRIRWVFTYFTTVNIEKDEYYEENFVLGDLPAGRYEIEIPYVSGRMRSEIDINSGAISYFSFHGYDGFQFEYPEIESPINLPPSP